MNGQMLFETCHFLPLPPAPTYRDALTSSCSDLIETVLALHSNTLVSISFLYPTKNLCLVINRLRVVLKLRKTFSENFKVETISN
ncbi:hypothetical protein CRE_26275 [Caenorhabditis remanei]|uniref:Uncharacterized protein n=1 Tax=Caenorhabditis remanei TaxID=31234 RepID=E3LR44_CAERE|nr:hypothetical protein CRE_26275 [Caenorhabditis remanei]